ncbi:MAG: sigma-70 family RNA polymerase sigma factor [Clostridia bacterium]|nr:sigma-70 family RNA polymerase sigma factor [Clostridia bacterium]
MESGLEKEFDSYIRKTIKHTIINFAKYENIKRQREVSIELLPDSEFSDNSLSFCDSDAALENYFSDCKIAEIVAKMPKDKKDMLKLKLVDGYSTKEIATIYKKSEVRIRHIISDALKEIKSKYEE